LRGRLGTGKRNSDPIAGLPQQPLGVVERILPRDLLEAAPADAPEWIGDPVLGVQVGEAEAALVAEPALVDLRVVAREDPPDLAFALVGVDVAADRAKSADGRDALQLPGSDLKARLGRQQRADRA